MTRIPIALLLACCAAAGCGGDPGVAAAERAFTAFQDALRRGDETACRALVTAESAPALAAVPWARVAAQQPLAVIEVRRGSGEFRVAVQDPNDGGRAAEFVVVREDGDYVVDLVATAGLNQVVTGRVARQEFVPRPLAPQDHDRIRQAQLARPPR